MELKDTELLERWRSGDRIAGNALFNRYYEAIERFFLNKVSSEVADLVQETFVACVAARDRVNDGTKFRAYIFSIAYNVLCGHLRKIYSSGQQLDVDEISVHDVMKSPDTSTAHGREQRLLLEALRNIPIRFQVILELHYWEDMTTEEIADILQLPVGTVRSRLRRARELLKQAMGRLAHSADELESTWTRLEDWAQSCRTEMLARQS
jgi:RNA polymerase sigma-70 factor (ECF subfamily)